MKNKKMIAGLLLAVGVSSANAAIMLSATAPTDDNADISKLTRGNTKNFTKGFSAVNNILGESITTGNNSGGYLLSAFSFKMILAQTNVGTTTAAQLALQVRSADGTVIKTETMTYSGTRLADQWMTLTFSTDFALAANTVYGINGLIVDRGTGDALFAGTARSGTDSYLAGEYYNTGGAVTTDGTDILFHADLAAVVVPEPSSTALLGLGGLALILRRRK